MGRSSHELLRTRFPQPLSQIQAQLHHDGHWQGELAHVRQGGTEIFVASYWALHYGDVGEKDVIIEINNDITSLKRAEAELRDSEVKLRLALDASGQGVWQWDLTGGIGQMICDDGCKALFGITDNVPLSYEQWTRTLTADRRVAAEAALARALDPADPHDDYAGEHHFTRSDGETLWLIAAGRALFQQDPTTPAGRRPLRVIGTIRDVSEIRRSEQERQRSEALLRTIVETAPALIYAKDRDSRMLLANEPVMALIGKPWDQVQGRTDAEFLDNADQARAVLLNDRRVMATGQTERLEELVGGADGQARVWVSIKAPMCGPDGAVIGLVGISVEITEHKRAQDRLRLMVNELNHRVKNTLSTVQALTTQTLRGLDPAMRQNLEARLLALSSAHDVLTRQGWESGSLRDLVSEALIPFDGWNAARFWISGPPISLRPSAVLAMAMGLHELATNALKYGALSEASGRVEIHWETTVDDEPLLRFLWTERHGPIVCVPTTFWFRDKTDRTYPGAGSARHIEDYF